MRFSLIENPPVKLRYRDNVGKTWHQFEGTPNEYFRWMETLDARKLRRYLPDSPYHWAGFEKESPKTALQARASADAFAALESNKATLHAPLKAPAKPQLSPVGSSFSMGRIMQGHPVACFRRPRTALPPKTINIALSVSAFVDQSAIAASIAKIAAAAWSYHLNGGSVTIKLHYLLAYSKKSPDGASGLISTIIIPIADIASLATGASVQFFRGIAIPAAKCLSGADDDGLPVADSTIPGVFTLNGKPENDAPILEALRIS